MNAFFVVLVKRGQVGKECLGLSVCRITQVLRFVFRNDENNQTTHSKENNQVPLLPLIVCILDYR